MLVPKVFPLLYDFSGRLCSTAEGVYGDGGMERDYLLRTGFDSDSHVCRRSREARQPPPDSQSLQYANQAAAILSALQPHRGSLRNSEGLRIREGAVRSH